MVVEFYTKWCGDCKVFNPIYDKLIDFFKPIVGDDSSFGRIDVEEQETIADEFKIKKYPTVAIYHAGNPEIIDKLIEPNKYEPVKEWIIKNCNFENIIKKNQKSI